LVDEWEIYDHSPARFQQNLRDHVPIILALVVVRCLLRDAVIG
jgi:hypothetical protein